MSLVQLSDHDNDYDDIVPELGVPALVQSEKTMDIIRTNTDFSGAKYTEIYDEWKN